MMKTIAHSLLIAGICLGSATLFAATPLPTAEELLAVNTNFGPARPAGITSPAEPPPAPTEPAPAPAKRAPAPAKPAPAVAKPTPVAPPPSPAVSAPADAGANALAEETVRRQESQLVAQQIISEGVQLYYEAKYPEAIAKLDKALKLLPRAPATEVDYNRAARAMGDSYYRLADAAYRANDTAKAIDLAKKSLEYSPDNRGSENIIAKIKLDEQKAASNAAKKAHDQARAERPEPVRKPRTPDLDETPEYKAKEKEISKLFREARILANSGQYDEAEQRYKQVLLIDHYNEDAYRNLQELNDNRRLMTEEGVDASRRRRLWEVTESWLPKLTSEVKRPQEQEKAADINVSSVAKTKIEDKLRKIKFPDVSFREAAISDVVKFLSEESVKFDPDKEGVNIVLGGGLQSAAAPAPAPAPAPATPDATAPAPVPTPTPTPGGVRPITLSLRNVPMADVLKFVTSLGGLKMRVDASAVIILPADAVENSELVTRTYNVSPDAIRSLISGGSGGATPIAPPSAPGGMTGTLAAPTSGGGGGAGSAELKTFFTDAGVPFPTGSSLTYYERARTIYVRNTVENMEIFERVLSTFNVVPTQVEIESKFIEISQSDLDELGFQWQVGPFNVVKGYDGKILPGNTAPQYAGLTVAGGDGTASGTAASKLTQGLRGAANLKANAISALLVGASSAGTQPDTLGTFSGIINGSQMGVVINALSQKQSTDILSAPKVTTLSGAQAQIRVVQEFIYPTEYSQPQVGAGGGGGTGTTINVPTPSIPSGWKTRDIGVILNVTPTVNADGYTINLTLVPEVSAFLGMLNYSPGDILFPGGSVPFKIWQPLFETRNLTTSVVIWDGQSVVLGGLIREEINKINDKVPFFGDIPFIGRLFRSKVDSRTKRNLLIFVTARLVDPAGNPVHKAEPAAMLTTPSR